MPSFVVKTPQRTYSAIVERGILKRTAHFIPKNADKVFVILERQPPGAERTHHSEHRRLNIGKESRIALEGKMEPSFIHSR
jgi:hypothetical protein